MPWRIISIGVLLFSLLGSVCAQTAGTTYQLGPQDEITVTVLRHPELSQNYTVPPDGWIAFPRADRINVTKKTTAEVAEALKAKYALFLVEPQVTVVLAKARVKNVFVMGAINKPGPYPIMDNTRISELIAAAGDLVGEQKELTATLKRGDQLLTVDLQAVISGKKPEANLVLQEGDQLNIIAPVKVTVTVLGQVKNPGAVKIREGGTPVDALAQAGDVTDRPERMRITLVRGTELKKIAWGDAATVLKDGDVIQVEKEQQARIYVSGQVKNPEAYELPEGGGVLEAIAMAGGVLPTASLAQVTIERAGGQQERVDLSQAFSKGIVNSNPKLAAGDHVIVPEWTARFSVWGKVNNAGNFPLSETVPVTVIDALSMAGGTDKRAKLGHVMVIRVIDKKPTRINVNVDEIIKKGKQELNIAIKAGDIVYVPETDRPDWSGILGNLSSLGVLVSVL